MDFTNPGEPNGRGQDLTIDDLVVASDRHARFIRTLQGHDPPFSQLIEGERRRWTPFKRALPKADQVVFDRLFDCAKLHVQAGVMLSRPLPLETIVMAVLLEHEKRIERLLEQLADEQPRDAH